MNCILVGYGEIGKAVNEVYGKAHKIDVIDKRLQRDRYSSKYDLMLVAIPYSDDFVDIVLRYKKRFKPEGTIIFSTVQIGTTAQIHNAVHSPVEGKHPELAQSIRTMTRWVGGADEVDEHIAPLILDFLAVPIKGRKLNLEVVSSSSFTEFLKMASTSLYGVNIEFARYRNSVAKELGMDYELVKKFDLDYNKLYKGLGMTQFQRYILDPPKGDLGGHCVTPNSVLLDKQFPSLFLKEIYRKKGEDE